MTEDYVKILDSLERRKKEIMEEFARQISAFVSSIAVQEAAAMMVIEKEIAITKKKIGKAV